MKQKKYNNNIALGMGTPPVLLGLLLICCSISTGCNQARRPNNLPKLYPCSITITQDGQPASDVLVSLYDQSGQWAISGKTGEDGIAQIKTHGQFSGAPSGEYVVLLDKSETEGGRDFAATGGSSDEIRVYSYVDPQYRMQETSPLKISVTGKSTNETFEIGPAERVLIMQLKPGQL